MSNVLTLTNGHDDGPDLAADGFSADSEKAKVFLRLFLENQRRLYAYVLTLVPHRADADDVLQDVSYVLWEKFDEHDPPADFTAWGCRIAYFKVLDHFKKRRRSRVRFSQEMLERLGETALEQAETLQLDERRAALSSCLQKLSLKDRNLLNHRFADGATTESTATAVGRSVEAVYKALSRIRQMLYHCISRSLAQEHERY